MDLIEQNQKSLQDSREGEDAKADISYGEIVQRTGGILDPLLAEDLVYVERIINGVSSGRISRIQAIAEYTALQIVKNARRKIIEVQEAASIIIDLSPYKLHTKFTIQFPATRTIANIAISIEGIANLKYGIESIIMSGLDGSKDYLLSDKRGTITFTLDSTDYEFPSSIYHFGGFATGGTPAYIFLQIDYTEADSSSSFKYIEENAIYADVGKAECELWSINSIPDSDGNDYIAPFKENTTLVLKNNGVLSQSGYDAMVDPQADLRWYISFEEKNVDYFGSDLLDMDLQIYLGEQMPILKSTGILNINNKFYMNAMTRNQSGNISGTNNYFYSDRLFRTIGTENMQIYLDPLKGNMFDDTRWDTLPTDFGLYRVIVKGKFAQNQLNN